MSEKPISPLRRTAYNETRPHQGRWCYGKTPMQTFLDALPIAREEIAAGRVTPDTIFVGHPPRRRASRQVKCILLHMTSTSRTARCGPACRVGVAGDAEDKPPRPYAD